MTEVSEDIDTFLELDSPEIVHELIKQWKDRVDPSSHELLFKSKYYSNVLQLIGSSEYAATLLIREYEWLSQVEKNGELARSIDPEMLAGFSRLSEQACGDLGVMQALLRRCRNRRLLHILWRSIAGHDDVWQSLHSLSLLADALIASSIDFATESLTEQYGEPLNKRGEPVHFIVVAMGKLGGQELNFSSDVDLLFLYSEEGEIKEKGSLSGHEFFVRLSRKVITLLDEVTEDGFVYRVDTRLRPFGKSGPLVLSFAALESYLLQHGRSWERYAYVKARVVSPTTPNRVIAELQNNIINPFVYRRYLDYGVFESLRDMKTLIENDVQRRELADNIKLGSGGIREIEFITQCLQLVRGGSIQELRSPSLRKALSKLQKHRYLDGNTVKRLLEAYEFLRRTENSIQAIRDQQTHDLPKNTEDRIRLIVAMQYANWELFEKDVSLHREYVSGEFKKIAFRGEDKRSSDRLTCLLETQWSAAAGKDEWTAFLLSEEYKDAEHISRAICRFADSSLQRQTDVAAGNRLNRFMPVFLASLKNCSHPGNTCERMLAILLSIVRRSSYIALLNENHRALDQLMELCDQSMYLADQIKRFPALLDELLDLRVLNQEISVSGMRQEMETRLHQVRGLDQEAIVESLAAFQRAALFRIGVADIIGGLPIMKVSDRLTELAEIVLDKALELVWSELTEKYGEPRYITKDGSFKAGLGIIAYGKLGGIELSYRSDLDLVFLHDSQGSQQQTDGDTPIDNNIFFSRLIKRLLHFITTQTGSGALYEVDTRLRPSGQSGLLVVSMDSFAKYQKDNAWTWEHQALLRSRPVSGSNAIGKKFEQIRSKTLRDRVRREDLTADVLSMREKMHETLDQSSETNFDLKQGSGGIADIEFIVQYLVLKHAAKQPDLIRYSDNIRQLAALKDAALLSADDMSLLTRTYKAYRKCMHHLILDDKPALVDIAEFIKERDFVRKIWAREIQ
ncbi:MAG: bifunctional [glutamate--ammonia ligase]-adenylyl-L-tyrosine phosphorylase/[glutamate--ammonia-ligase] adenylyltransferase [Woeseia sp.]|nr:bifunctional [glutamate--ammonia ligase]-adenylyl-L-tyrosine phosphorylase/[glutamate--ammonia-ligase] adenylyltransferase [Woeseia sp.]|tara:strand:+ start:519 stop:3419 length:2901 start_codon:yes stop_codon:yes gene_type:complete